jgi:hypothetical protein
MFHQSWICEAILHKVHRFTPEELDGNDVIEELDIKLVNVPLLPVLEDQTSSMY